MTRIFLVDPHSHLRTALRRLLQELGLQAVGEAADWTTALAAAQQTRAEMWLVEWELIAAEPARPLAELRALCPRPIVIVLLSALEAHQQAARSAGADAFISKTETPDRIVARLQAAQHLRPS